MGRLFRHGVLPMFDICPVIGATIIRGDSIESPRIIVTEHGMGYKFVRPANP